MKKIKKTYGELSATESELIIKLILCTVISMLFTWAIGNPYSPTTAVTANLFLYTDRGYVGGCKYAFRRILVQILQGVILMIIIIPCKYWLQLPIPDTIIMIIAGCLALAVGLPINFKHQYAPYNCTLANATFVIMCSMVHDLHMFPIRVLECIVGFFIGYAVNYVIMPKHIRYNEAVKKARTCMELVMKDDDLLQYHTVKAQLATDIKYLSEDAKRGLNRHKCTEEQLSILKDFYVALDFLELLNKRWELYNQSISGEFREEYQEAYAEVVRLHERVIDLLDNKEMEELQPIMNKELKANNKEESIIQVALWEYSEQILKLVGQNV